MSAFMINRQHIVIGALTLSLGALARPGAAAETKGNKAELMALTGGQRVKVVWNQGGVKYYDSQDDTIIVLPFKKDPSAPLLTSDGRYVLASVCAKAEREVMMYDTKKKTIKTLCTGLSNNLLAVWTDPKTKKIWVYVNGTGDHDEPWNEAKGGPVYRFPADKPEARELVWDRTSSHLYLTIAGDGTRACFEPSWGNIGQLKLAFTADGKVDQDKSEYKPFGGGCFPSMAPDNSYRLFRLEGDHRGVTLCDADNANQRRISTDGMLNGGGGQTWLTRWSTHPRYMTCMAPDSDHAMIWLGKFDENFTKIEKWVRVSETNAPKCWQSQAWVEPGK